MRWIRFSTLFLACGALTFAACTEDVTSPTATDEAAPEGAFKVTNSSAAQDGKYLVMFKKSGIPAGFTDEVAGLGGTVEFTHGVGLATVSGLSAEAATALAKNKAIGAVEADVGFEFEPIFEEGNVASFDANPASPGNPTTASFYARQWNMRAIDADVAWAAGRTGSSGVTLAILDTGIDYTYPDLLGLVDLSRSASFVPEDDFYVGLFFPGKHLVTDIHYHGTHVASTAVSNSDVIAGVTTQTTLIGVKVCSAVLGYCPFSAIVQGVLFAVDNGADVINMSLGGGFEKAGSEGLVGFYNMLFNYARSAGVTMVVSAGNEAIDLDHDGDFYKTYCSTPNTICVSATGPTSGGTSGPWTDIDSFAGYSNYGRSAINVAAPGGTGSPGWVWAACSQTSLVIPVCQTGTYIVGLGGTSMSAPHVSGLAALMVEDVGRNPGRIKAAIQKSADDLGQPGTDPWYGKGRINVATAVGAN